MVHLHLLAPHSPLGSEMEGRRGGAPSPSSLSSPSVVCCMCGDYGLHRELFRCKVCLSRSQHKYCSDLYPKAEAYRACNWCLREEGGKPAASVASAAMDHSSSTHSNNDNNGSNVGRGLMKLHRGAFPSYLNKPVKKPRQLERSVSDVAVRARAEELSPGSGKGRQVFRGKARRYKLLEEVSS